MADDAGNTATADRPAAAAHRSHHNIWLAIAWMGLALVSFTITAVAGREVGRTMSAMNMVFYRNAISLVLLIAGMWFLGIRLASLRTEQPGWQMARALAHFMGQWTWMMALLMIPLIELVALEFTAPLWVAVIAPFLLGERLTGARVAAAILGFVGAMIVILGPVYFRQQGIAGPAFALGSALALACAVFFALNMTGTKFLTRKDGALTILMFMTVNHTILAGVLSIGSLPLPDARTLPWVLGLGVTSLAAHFGLARALYYADTLVVAPLDFLRLPLLAAIGILAYDEVLHPVVVLGTLVVLGANMLNLWGERLARRPG